MFKLKIIGSGTIIPTKERCPSCYLLEVGTKRILLDIGHGSVVRLVEQGIDMQSIDMLFVSHFHTDHFADMLPLIHARWIDDIHHSGRENRPITIVGPKTIKKRWLNLREIFWPEPEEHYSIKFKEGPRKFSLDDIGIEIFEVRHVDWFQSVGIKISFQGKTFVYTGDIGSRHSVEDLGRIIENVNLLLIEGGSVKPAPNHFTVDQIVEIVDRSDVEKTIITHLRKVNLPILKNKIKDKNKIILARDLMEVEIR